MATAGKAYKQLDTLVEKTVKKDGKDRTYNKGRSPESNQLFREWLKNFEFEQRTFSESIETLENRAASFGVLASELSERLKRIEGEIFSAVSLKTARQITIGELDQWLTRDKTPKQLCTQENATAMKEELSQLSRHIREPQPLLMRMASADLLDRSIECPIVQVYGEGGVGKSVLVFEHLLSRLSIPPPFVSARDARSSLEYWPGELLVLWRNSVDENLRKEPLDTVLARLENASKGKESPLLAIFLDGIDERDSDEVAPIIRALAASLEKERLRCIENGGIPRVQLYVTCRRKNGWSSLIGIENSFNDDAPEVHSVKIEGFSDVDLRNLSDSFLPKEVCDRIHNALRSNHSSESRRPQDELFEPVTSETQSFVDAMRHPPLLASLRRVALANPSDAIRAFDGDSNCCKAVSLHYIGWFANKVVRRKMFEHEHSVFRMLNLILVQTGNNVTVLDYQEFWITPLAKNNISILDADRLFREAVSAGITIQESPTKWRWRNGLVCLGVIANNQLLTETQQ